MRNTFSALVITSLLVACGSTPATVQFYRIDPEAPSQTESTVRPDAKSVVLERVELPGFLSRPGLVMQSGDNTITISKVHLWAERLDKALPRLLTSRLQNQSDDFLFYQGHSDWVSNPDFSLRVRFDNLQPTAGGEVHASGSFQLMDARSSQPGVLHEFRFSRDMQRDGYTEAVALLDALLSDTAAAILGVLNTMRDEPTS